MTHYDKDRAVSKRSAGAAGRFHYEKEGDLISDALNVLEEMGIWAWRNNKGMVGGYVRYGGPRGASDILGILPDGRFLAAEAKMPGNKPSADQREFIDKVNKQGGVGFVFYSTEEMVQCLKKKHRRTA